MLQRPNLEHPFRGHEKLPFNERSAVIRLWTKDQPAIQVQAMVLAADTLFIAGPPGIVDEEDAFLKLNAAEVEAILAEQRTLLEGKQGARRWTVSADQQLRSYEKQNTF